MPVKSALTIPGRLGRNTKIPSDTPCLVDMAAVDNLSLGISVNCFFAKPKGSVVPVIIMNQNNHNVWIQQPLLAAEFFWVEHLPWDYGVEFHQEGQKIEVAFQPLPPADVMASTEMAHNEPDNMQSVKEASQDPCPTFGPCSHTQVVDFNFEKEVEHLPFKLNLGDFPLEEEHQAKFDLINSNQEVFSSHDEDLGYSNQLDHTLLTSTNEPVCLPHRTIPRQFQGEVHKCLNTSLHQGIICPSNSPYAS